ncbi:MAG: DUF2807 domain-containing protein [Bacteroidales bacterium]|nr:DUF2807 domain-containing protein [Bacteroidales bacterium]MBN2762139.1 DUF2807 domain-containing protein [Bacteroidales bacterium]
MKKVSVFAIPMLLLAFSASSQDTVTRELPPFTRLYVADKITVELYKTDKESATIKTQGIDPADIQTVVENNTLNIKQVGSHFSKKKVLVKLYFREIKELEIVNGAEVLTTSLFKADSLKVTLKSGGMLYLDADIKYLNSYVAEGALLTGEGYATTHDAVVATYATLSAYDLESETVNIKASSGGKAKIAVESVFNAEASSGGTISYKGEPQVKNITAGSGTQVEPYKE